MRAFPRFRLPGWLAMPFKSICLRSRGSGHDRPVQIKRGRRALSDEGGASAVEFAMVVLPFFLLCLGILQFLMLHYTQQILSDALYSTASSPEVELIAGNKSGYIAKLCAKIVFQSSCLNATTGVQVELMRLSDLPTAATGITGTTFNAGSVNDVLVLRAKMPAPQIISLIPQMMAMDSVIFRR